MADRNIGAVVDQMLAIESFPGVGKDRLRDLLNSLRYKAPEQIEEMWGLLGSTCTTLVGNKAPHQLVGWEKELIELLLDKKL